MKFPPKPKNLKVTQVPNKITRKNPKPALYFRIEWDQDPDLPKPK